MIQSRITAKAQTTVPRAVRQALGVGPGDTLGYEIDGETVVVTRASVPDERAVVSANYYTSFNEWFDELDAEFDER